MLISRYRTLGSHRWCVTLTPPALGQLAKSLTTVKYFQSLFVELVGNVTNRSLTLGYPNFPRFFPPAGLHQVKAIELRDFVDCLNVATHNRSQFALQLEQVDLSLLGFGHEFT